MSEPKLISPMLDDFAMGEPISSHHGVCCCPAMRSDSDNKYIVKIISIPASQIQLQALLLTGAFSNEASARDYFQELAHGIVAETDILAKLAKLEGFLPYEDCQIVPMENGTGFDVYLLSSYKRSLTRHFRKDTITHLAAVNLGLDMCASLAVCRQSGYLYADLKPENIFICNDKEYRIGDIGFLKLDSLKYASLPERYISAYTAPEILDAYSDINPTIDIYAAGMILYQAYNGGVLPFEGRAPAEVLPPPAYADYEMAEIILKACAPDPKDRWEDPIAMGQALVAYMQRNGANDVPIATPTQDPIPEDVQEAPAPEAAESVTDDTSAPEADDICADDFSAEASDEEQICLDEFYDLCADDGSMADSFDGELDLSEFAEETESIGDADIPEVDTDDTATAEEEDLLNLSFLDDMVNDDTAPSEDMAEDFTYNELSQDASSILAQADDLISHETPEGVVPPEAIEIPMPEPIVLPDDSSSDELLEDNEDEDKEDYPEDEDEDEDEDEEDEEDEDAWEEISLIPDDSEAESEEADQPEMTEEEEKEYIRAMKREERKKRAAKRKVVKRCITVFIVLLVLAGLAFGGYMFYKEYYLRSVTSLKLTGSEDQLVVSIVADVDESALTVYCIDTSGTAHEQPVVNGKAVFTGLTPNTFYNVKVEVSGLHKLTGEIADSYTTPVQTNILSFSAVTGTDPGTAILTFTIDGMDSDTWYVTYSAEGVEEQKQIFSGHVVNISGLVSGKTYTFRLASGSDLYIAGIEELVYTAKDPVFAQDLDITGCTSTSLDVRWSAPEGVEVESWTVRCYSDSGYDQTVVTEQCAITFTGLDGNEAHIVEVTAAGMSAGTRCYMTDNAVTVYNISAEKKNDTTLLLTWDFDGNTPENQWIVTYNVDGCAGDIMVRTETNSTEISPLIPGGAYNFTILLEDGTRVFTEPVMITVPEADQFSAHGLKTTNVDVSMCRTPAKAGWDRHDLAAEDYTNTFTVGEKASFLLYAKHPYDPVRTEFQIMYVIHAEDGTLISNDIVKLVWRNMWSKNYCELDVPALPDTPGTYSIEVYLNGMILHSQNFQIVSG